MAIHKPGTKVQALNIPTVNPAVRGAVGTVVAYGNGGTYRVQFEHQSSDMLVHESIFDVISPPLPQEESPPTE